MRGRGFRFDRGTFDGATPLVSSLLGREIARFVFGPEAEAERAIADDQVIQEAVRLAAVLRRPMTCWRVHARQEAGAGGRDEGAEGHRRHQTVGPASPGLSLPASRLLLPVPLLHVHDLHALRDRERERLWR